MDDKNFDQFINDALNNYNAESAQSDWGEFESLLEQADSNEETDQFDEQVRDLLIGHQVPYQAKHWDLLEERLEHSLHADYANELDQYVNDKVQGYSVPYKSSTWPILQQKLIQRKEYIRRLIFTKSIEAAIVIFAIFTFYTYWPYYHNQYVQYKEGKAIAEQHSEAKTDQTTMQEKASIALQNTLESSNAVKKSTSNTESTEQIISNRVQSVEDHVESSSLQMVAAVGQSENDNNLVEIAGQSGPASKMASRIPRATELLPMVAYDLARLDRFDKLSPSYPTFDQAKSEKGMLALSEKENLDVKLKKKLLNKRPDLGEDVVLAATALEDNIRLAGVQRSSNLALNEFEAQRKKAHWRVGMFGSVDANFVNIPQNVYLDRNADKNTFVAKDRLAAGYSAGLTVLLDAGSFGVETGIIYSSKQYDPERSYRAGKPTEGLLEVKYKNIHLDIIEVPVQVSYRWLQSGRWSLYGTAGASIHAIAVSDHDLVIPRPSYFSLAPTSSSSTIAEVEAQRIKSHFLDAPGNNLYLSANFGMGAEFRMSEKYSLYLEPNYKHQISKGIGPNKDRINSTSLRLGSRMSF